MYLKEFKNIVYNKLFITNKEASLYGASDGTNGVSYNDMVVPFLNEALNLIANGDLSVRKTILVVVKPTLRISNLPVAASDTYEITQRIVYELQDGTFWIVNRTGSENAYVYAWANTSDPNTYTFDREVMSVKYADTEVSGASFYVTSSVAGQVTIKVNRPGNYKFVVEATYPLVTDDEDEDSTLAIAKIPESVLYVAALYVTSQLLNDTDQIRAQLVRNEYELALARLDEERQDIQESFSISSKW